jgi:hypothetical protein
MQLHTDGIAFMDHDCPVLGDESTTLNDSNGHLGAGQLSVGSIHAFGHRDRV